MNLRKNPWKNRKEILKTKVYHQTLSTLVAGGAGNALTISMKLHKKQK